MKNKGRGKEGEERRMEGGKRKEVEQPREEEREEEEGERFFILPRITEHGAAFLLFLPLMLTIIFPPLLTFIHNGCHTLGGPGWRESRK